MTETKVQEKSKRPRRKVLQIVYSTAAYIIIGFPIFFFYAGYSFTIIKLMNLATGDQKGISEALSSNIPILAVVLTSLAFITNACIGIARIDYNPLLNGAFKRTSLLFLISTIGYISIIIILIGISGLYKDSVTSWLLGDWRGRLAAALCVYPSLVAFSTASFMVIFAISSVARRLLARSFNHGDVFE